MLLISLENQMHYRNKLGKPIYENKCKPSRVVFSLLRNEFVSLWKYFKDD